MSTFVSGFFHSTIRGHVYQGLIPFCFCVISYPMNILQMVIHSSLDGHLGCSLFGAMMNKASMEHSCIYILTHKSISKNGTAGYKAGICLALTESFKQFSKVGCTNV